METVGRCVRVQAYDGYAEKIRSLTFCEDYTGLLAVRHGGLKGENPHYHIVVRTTIQEQTFRKRMKTMFPDGKGNKHMSIVPWDGNDKALSYLFHEDPDVAVIVRKGITDDHEARLRAQNLQIKDLVKTAKQKASWTLEEDAYTYFKELKENRPVKITVLHIGEYIILHALRSGKYMPQPWLLKSMAIKVQFRLLEGNVGAEEEFACALANNILGTR